MVSDPVTQSPSGSPTYHEQLQLILAPTQWRKGTLIVAGELQLIRVGRCRLKSTGDVHVQPSRQVLPLQWSGAFCPFF